MKVTRKWVDGPETFWEVAGSGGVQHRVRVDRDGAWHCTCRGCTFHGSCHHIQAIRWEREWSGVSPKLELLQPTPVSEPVLMELMKLPRFILQLQQKGPRSWLCIARKVYFGGVDAGIHIPDTFAGTVFDVVKVSGEYLVQDLIFCKGVDYRTVPLRDRIIKQSETIEQMKAPALRAVEIEVSFALKRGIYRWSRGNVILKDLGSLYNTKPRNWLVKK